MSIIYLKISNYLVVLMNTFLFLIFLSNVQSIWVPAQNVKWDIQLDGTFTLPMSNPSLQVVDLDLFDNSAAIIRAIKSKGIKVICYFSAGSSEDWRSDFKQFPPKVLGNALDGWPGERYLDIRSVDVVKVMKTRINLSAQKGCDAIDPDNVDLADNNPGFKLTVVHAVKYMTELSNYAHSLNLSIGLKNYVSNIKLFISIVDFAINESCNDYNECNLYNPFTASGKSVLGISYKKKQPAICVDASKNKINLIFKNVALNGRVIYC
jgi:hypothetical protein